MPLWARLTVLRQPTGYLIAPAKSGPLLWQDVLGVSQHAKCEPILLLAAGDTEAAQRAQCPQSLATQAASLSMRNTIPSVLQKDFKRKAGWSGPEKGSRAACGCCVCTGLLLCEIAGRGKHGM